MPLTPHQLLHINALISECNESLGLSDAQKDKLSEGKNVKRSEYDKYLRKVLKDAEKIKKDDVFPNLKHDNEIHDLLEKENDAEYYKPKTTR